MKRLTYDFEIGGNHCWQVKGADNLECREVCERQGDSGCKTCPIAKAFDRLAAIEDILGDEYDLERLRELVQADREGRCVVLPCKIDGAVYTIDRSLGGYDYVTETKFWWSDVPEVGETIFLTRAEAVAALKAREQDG